MSNKIDKNKIYNKFGAEYLADNKTFLMGIDVRFTEHFAIRIQGMVVLETCTGGGFSTISLARYAQHVYTVEIDNARMEEAKKNAQIAGVEDKVTFINGDILSKEIQALLPPVEAAFLDPDWAVAGPNHHYKFIDSNTCPPSDILLNLISSKTQNVMLIQPPFINANEFNKLPAHECEYLYLDSKHELFCLYFGRLARIGRSEYRI
ncbi:MAG TPA: rRNA adenine N-6-methyltransferase family protein [Candidatus Dependentiae bacterium]|nr:rRNA adenine N-6-methyltransferase family protein [Candidatus Dependentiae bacterium]